MNKERLLQLADRIEALGRGEPIDGLERFDMTRWWCKTAGCIAGSCYALRIEEGQETRPFFFHHDPCSVVAADLGLSKEAAMALFLGRWERASHLPRVTAAEAAQVLRDIANGVLAYRFGGWRWA